MGLEIDSQCHLQDARIDNRTSDLAEGGALKVVLWIAELRMIEQIKGFSPELDI